MALNFSMEEIAIGVCDKCSIISLLTQWHSFLLNTVVCGNHTITPDDNWNVASIQTNNCLINRSKNIESLKINIFNMMIWRITSQLGLSINF